MSAEDIAKVLADLSGGRVKNLVPGQGETVGGDYDSLFACAIDVARMPAKNINATAIYHSLVAREGPIYFYEDHPCIGPPFERFNVCYENEHGNVMVMAALSIDHWQDPEGKKLVDEFRESADNSRRWTQPPKWESPYPVEWDRVRWTIDTELWLGGHSTEKGAVRTAGPAHLWRFAVYDDGEPADLHWVKLVDYPMKYWDMAHLVLLGALNFLNCRNVTAVEPTRPRPERRRIERANPGLQLLELTVFPTGKSTRSTTGTPVGGTPLKSVRGHMAHYGDCCPAKHEPKGLLFGKLSGRYWIPQHALGSSEFGEHDTHYKLAN